VVSLDAPYEPTLLQVSTSRVGELDVCGELDIATGPLLSSRISAALANTQCQSVRLDLSEVCFIDCAGLGALLRGRAQARALGKDFVIERVGAPVRRFFARTEAGRSLLQQ
jgi:anti-anti-sigma factor